MKTTILKKLAAVAAIAVVVTGCKADWVLHHEPTTEAERTAVAQHVQAILAKVPETLSGFDQDWEDAIQEAHWQAWRTFCRPTLWEWKNGNYTGRWKYLDEQPVSTEAQQ